MVVETLSLDTINANSLQSLQQTLQTMQRLRVGTERVRSWYGAGQASVLSFGTSSPLFHTFIPQLSMLFRINSLSLSPENN